MFTGDGRVNINFHLQPDSCLLPHSEFPAKPAYRDYKADWLLYTHYSRNKCMIGKNWKQYTANKKVNERTKSVYRYCKFSVERQQESMTLFFFLILAISLKYAYECIWNNSVCPYNYWASTSSISNQYVDFCVTDTLITYCYLDIIISVLSLKEAGRI